MSCAGLTKRVARTAIALIVVVGPSRSAWSANDPPSPGPSTDRGTIAVEACDNASFCWSHPLPMGVDLNAVWVRSADDAWTVGDGGTSLHWDGRVWKQIETGTTENLVAVRGVGGGPEGARFVPDVAEVGRQALATPLDR